jgi:hypothetical protein
MLWVLPYTAPLSQSVSSTGDTRKAEKERQFVGGGGGGGCEEEPKDTTERNPGPL